MMKSLITIAQQPFQYVDSQVPLRSIDILYAILTKGIPLALIILGIILVAKRKRTSGTILIIIGSMFILRIFLSYYVLRGLL